MRISIRTLITCIATLPLAFAGTSSLAAQHSAQAGVGANNQVDLQMVARIREEGLQRSQLANTLSYMTDVLGARLTNSRDMERAQRWAIDEMKRIGLVNTVAEPFMDYGVSWDNEYVSLHLLEPDYQPMVGYPIAHTPGTGGKQILQVVIADVRTNQDLDKYRGRLRGKAVLGTPPPTIDLTRFTRGDRRRTDEEMRQLEQATVPPPRGPRPPANPDVLNAEQRLAFYIAEGAAVVLESRSGWPGAVRGFARPGAKVDRWSREATLASLPIVAVTPEHYNRMYRILARDIPVTIEVEIRNRIGDTVEQASNVLGEIPGTDLADEIVMLGAHFDTWHASPNASDNTSGVAVMLEAARILLAVGAVPRRTIRVALWSGEEQGLWGSRAYVRKHFGDPSDPAVGVTPDYEKFSVYFNQDYGPGEYRGIWLQENEHVRQTFKAWMEPFRDMGMTTISVLGVGSTDHVAFDDVGLPAFQFLQARVGGTGGHTNLDFFDTLPIEDLMKNAVIMASFVYHAAMSDTRIPRKGMSGRE
ncbi:MAG: M20/M25/M40 family metallo-hydrolase [Gemmatimonadetes bacterium]|nr:M20/M25/M40 family metallo-hydrolase [Gemmatimonadota bacterium]